MSNNYPVYIQEWHDYVENNPDKCCEDIKLLKQLIEEIMTLEEVWYDDIDVEAFIEFCGLFVHKSGRWAGYPFELSKEQLYIAACVFGLKTYDEELQMEVRYFTEAVLLVARKWGKSFFVSAVAAFLLMADGESAAQVWCLASVKSQAAIVYENTKNLLFSSDVLTPPGNPQKYWRTKRDRDNSEMLLFPSTGSFMKPAGKNSANQDGLDPHGTLIDELHAIKDRNTYDVFSSASGARTQPLIFIISTFGYLREGIFDSILKRCEARLQGKSKERLFPMIFRIDKDDDPAETSCWIKANPGIPEARPTMRYLKSEYDKALEDPAQMPSFLAKHLNRASSTSVVYFDLHQVDQCAIDMSTDMIQGKYAVGGVDASETHDLCCATALIPFDGKLHIFQKYFIAEKRIQESAKQDQMAYESFCNTGANDPLNDELLHICEGGMVDLEDIAEWYAHLQDKYDCIFWKIGSDRWHYNELQKKLSSKGFMEEDSDGRGVVFPIPWGAKTLSAPMKLTRVLFKDKIFVYSRYNGLLRWCTTNTAAKIDANNNIQPDKKSSKSRIDGYASLLASYIAYQKVKDDFEQFQP